MNPSNFQFTPFSYAACPSRAFRSSLLICAAGLALCLGGCVEEGDDGFGGFGNGTGPDSEEEDDGSGDGDGDGDGSGDGDGDGDGTGDGDGDGDGSGDGDGDGDGEPEPLPCDFELGCHIPLPPDSEVGMSSHVPIGCEGGSFERTFLQNVSSFADPEAPRSVPMLGDLDGDEIPELVLNFRKGSVGFVFHGEGDGGFDTGTPATLGGGLFAGGWGGDLGDINNDGRLDIVFGDHTRSARAWSNGGAMNFSEARNGLPDNIWFNGAGIADLNGDGNLDAIFGADQFSSGYSLYHGDGNGGWTEGTAPPTGVSNAGHILFSDYDSDGDLDVFSFSRGGSSAIAANVYRNDGGSFATVGTLEGASQYPSSADPVQGSVGDVNCDDIVDVAVGGSIYLGNGTGWTKATDVDQSKISHLADMNGDGHLDLITHDPSVGLALYIGDGTGSGWQLDTNSGLPGTEHTPSGFPFDTPYGIDVADLDGNDNLDVVRVAGFGNSFWVEAWTR
jgi:hypothetical protein